MQLKEAALVPQVPRSSARPGAFRTAAGNRHADRRGSPRRGMRVRRTAGPGALPPQAERSAGGFGSGALDPGELLLRQGRLPQASYACVRAVPGTARVCVGGGGARGGGRGWGQEAQDGPATRAVGLPAGSGDGGDMGGVVARDASKHAPVAAGSSTTAVARRSAAHAAVATGGLRGQGARGGCHSPAPIAGSDLAWSGFLRDAADTQRTPIDRR